MPFLLAALQEAGAVDGSWVGFTSEYGVGTNWTSNPNVPVLPADTATFSNTGSATVDSDSFVGVGAIRFTAAPDATAFTINNNDDFFYVTGDGILNDSTRPQTFNALGYGFGFTNSSTASGGTGTGGVNLVVTSVVNFLNTSTAGNANITNNATGNVNFSNSSTAGTATIANDGAITFSDTANAGTAVIANNATGTLTFSNSSSASGATIVNDGSLQFTNTSRAGTISTITNNNALDLSNASSAENAAITNIATMTFRDSSVAGTATINNSAGTLTFSNSASAQGATIVNNSILQFGDTSRAGTAAITNNATLAFSGSASADQSAIGNNTGITFGGSSTAGQATITYTTDNATTSFNDTSSAGSATIQTATGITGTITSFANASTAGSATIRNAPLGLTQFSNGATAGNAAIFNVGSTLLGVAATTFTDTSTAGNATITNTFGGVAFDVQSTAGTATIINNATGRSIFSGASSADRATIVNEAGPGPLGTGGLTRFDATSTAGNATITTRANGGVGFLNTSSGGTARFITEAAGAVDISQLTSGGTTAGSIEGAGAYYLGSKQLTVGGNNLSTTLSGVLLDGTCGCFGAVTGTGGSLVKAGTGTLTLAGINTYTGATTVNAGTLSVNGSTVLSSLTTVNAGGTLAGTGIVGATLINGGTLSPGNSAGTLTVQGNLVFTAAASYLYEVTPTVADRVNVTGTASLGGATVNAQFASGSYVTRQYTVVNATGGIIGTFGAQANTNLPSNFTSSLSYDANNAYLNLTLNFTPPSPGPNPPPGVGGLNQNQQNVGNALVGFFNRAGGIPMAFGALTPAGLTQVAGETATGSQQTTFDAMNLFMNLLTEPFVAGRGIAPAGPTAYAAEDHALAYASKRKSGAEREAFGMITKAVPRTPSFEARWNVWAAGFGGSQNTVGNAALGAGATTSQIYGGAVGADYWFSPKTVAGFAMAGGGTQFNVANAGSGRSDLFQAGAFLRHNAGPAYITGALAYGWQDITTERNVTIAGLDRLRAQFNANAYSGRVEGGYRFAQPWLAITPYAAGQFTTFELPSYAESVVSGANTFALAYGGKSVTATRSELGLRGDKSWALGDGLFTLRGRAAWAHDFNTDRNVQATFQTLPGASFVVNGAPRAREAALTTASAEWTFASGLALAATFEGEFSDVTRSYAGKGVARYTW